MKVPPPVRYTCGRCSFKWTWPPVPLCPACYPRRVVARLAGVLRFLEHASRPPA